MGAAMGRQLYALSRNIDRRRVSTGVRRRSVGAQRALGRAGNTMSDSEIDAVVVNLIDRITGRMRAAGRRPGSARWTTWPTARCASGSPG
ncbi:hypothetical protein JHV675_51110 [Mycobacterium avium subsp. hominissuis]